MSNIYRFPLGPLTAIAIADAAACGLEFVSYVGRNELKQKANLYGSHTMWPYLPAGSYSDDTQRALVLMEAWLYKKTYDDPRDIPIRYADVVGEALPEAYMRDPRGYGKGMFMKYQQWAEMSVEQRKAGFGSLFPQETKRDSAGAAMGAAVLGCLNLDSLDAIRAVARTQGELTHQGDGVLAAELTAATAYYLSRAQGKRSELRQYLHAQFIAVAGDRLLNAEPVKKPGNKGWDCFMAALQCLEQATSLHDLLLRCISLGGDTDTVASMAMGAAWNCRELANDLPPYLWYELEDGAYGRSHLRIRELAYLNNVGMTLRVSD